MFLFNIISKYHSKNSEFTTLYCHAELEDSALSYGTVDPTSEVRAATTLVLFVGNYKRAILIDLY
jgi:hypothetical protein